MSASFRFLSSINTSVSSSTLVRPLRRSRCSFTLPIPGTVRRSERSCRSASRSAPRSAPAALLPPPLRLEAETLKLRTWGCCTRPGAASQASNPVPKLPLDPSAACGHGAAGWRANIACTQLRPLVAAAPTCLDVISPRHPARSAVLSGALQCCAQTLDWFCNTTGHPSLHPMGAWKAFPMQRCMMVSECLQRRVLHQCVSIWECPHAS